MTNRYKLSSSLKFNRPINKKCSVLYFPSLLGPGSAPRDFTAMATSPTSIAVMWGEVLPRDQNGVITAYEVAYTALETFGRVAETVNVSGSIMSVDLTGLHEFVNYTISVRAFTDVGAGPYTDPVTKLTHEAGMCYYVLLCVTISTSDMMMYR